MRNKLKITNIYIEKMRKVPGFRNYSVSEDGQTVFSHRTKKNIASRRTKNGVRYELWKDNKKYSFRDDQLVEITFSKKLHEEDLSEYEDIAGYPDYKIDRNGKVYSLKRNIFLKPQKRRGYMAYRLYNEKGECRQLLIHRTTAITFVEQPDKDKKYVNHKNGEKHDNSAKNLEWCTHSENIKHAHKTGLNPGSARKVRQIEIIQEEGRTQEYKSIAEASRKTGVSSATICNACKKERISGGYRWKYSDPENTKAGKAQKILAIKIIEAERIAAEFKSAEEAAKVLGVSPGTITNACRDRIKLCKGYRWRYVDDTKDKKIDAGDWKTIPGYSNYKVSTTGDIYTTYYKRLLQPKMTADGYYTVGMKNDEGKRKTPYVHILVALAYIPNPEGKKTVNHKDKNPSNNSVDNLEWATHSEQVVHAYKTGKHNGKRPVIQYTKEGEEIARFSSIKEASDKTGANYSGIANTCKRIHKTSGGYKWKYDEK